MYTHLSHRALSLEAHEYERCLGHAHRYPWSLLQPLVLHLLQQVLVEYDAMSRVEVGPAPPPANDESLPALTARLSGAVEAFGEAPFTVQRLAEVLLEPGKQYSRLEKLVSATCSDYLLPDRMLEAGCPRQHGYTRGWYTKSILSQYSPYSDKHWWWQLGATLHGIVLPAIFYKAVVPLSIKYPGSNAGCHAHVMGIC